MKTFIGIYIFAAVMVVLGNVVQVGRLANGYNSNYEYLIAYDENGMTNLEKISSTSGTIFEKGMQVLNFISKPVEIYKWFAYNIFGIEEFGQTDNPTNISIPKNCMNVEEERNELL